MMNFWRQDVTKNCTVKLDFVSGTNNVMIPIPEEIMEHIRWNSDTQLYMRLQDGKLLISETNYSEENVNANIEAYYDQIGNVY